MLPWLLCVQLHDQDVELPQPRGFKLFLRTYTFNSASGTFEAVPGMPSHLPAQINKALNALHSIETKGALTHLGAIDRANTGWNMLACQHCSAALLSQLHCPVISCT